jgi:hypothetical protein
MFARTFTLAILLALAAHAQTNSSPQPPASPQEMSLAERAAAARKATPQRNHGTEASNPDAPPPPTLEQRGSIQGSRYVNDFLHFQIELANRWQPLSAGRMALDEVVAQKYLNPERGASSYRVLWMGDSAGRNVVLSIVALPPDAPTDLDQLAAAMKKVAFAQLARAQDLRESREQVLLGDSAHGFAAFRLTGTVQDTRIVQSAQLTLSNGFLLLFTITGRSDQDVSDAVRSLKSSLTWTAAKP